MTAPVPGPPSAAVRAVANRAWEIAWERRRRKRECCGKWMADWQENYARALWKPS